MIHGDPLVRGSYALPTLLGALLVLLLSTLASGLIFVGRGNDPVRDNNWPAGSVDVANLKTRVGWCEGPPFGGGQHQFFYRGDAADFQAALDAFARVKAPKLELYVSAGPHEVGFLKDDKDPKADVRVDWAFTVWNPESWNHLYNNPNSNWNAEDPNFRKPVDAPRMDVYVTPGRLDWSRVKVPANVAVTDNRASANGFPDGSAAVGDVYDIFTSKPIPGAQVALTRNNGQNERHEYVWETVASTKADDDGHFEIRRVPPGSYRVTASSSAVAPRMLGYATFGPDTLARFTAKLSGTAQVSGTVLDTDGKPAAGVTVRADSIMGPDGLGYDLPDRPQATTDAQGKFTVDGLPRGHCQLFAYGGHFFLLDAFKVQDVPSADARLRVTATGSLKIKVTRADGTPPAVPYGVHVDPVGGGKVGSWGGGADVKPDGTFQFDDVPPGKYTVSARPNPGPADDLGNPRDVEVKAGETTEVAFPAK